jgi:hypothetical protein
MATDHTPKMYAELAAWFPLLSPPAEYAEEAEIYRKLLCEACTRPARTLLELGSGAGSNASFLKAHFQMVLVDLSPDMLAVSEALNPECEHIVGDMRSVRLARQFDRVFIHDAICYMTTLDDLALAIETAFVHCAPGGAVLFAPDHVRENFRASTDHGGHDDGVRGLRYLEWSWDPDPDDTTYLVDYAYMLRERDGTVRVEYDRHTEGLFARGDWLRLLGAAGFDARVVPFEHSELESGEHEMFLATK